VRFVFSRGTFDYETLEVLTGLREQGFLPEQATDRMYVTDVVSSEEYQRVRQYLEPWQWSGRVKIAEVSSMEEMLEILAS
jgi:peptidyl-tRNA hydrolase